LLALGTAAGLVGGYFLYRSGVLTVGSVYLLVQYINLLGRPVHELTWRISGLQEVGGGVQRIAELQSRASPVADTGTQLLPEGPLPIGFQAVGFRYADQEPVLSCVTFALEPGRVLGLLGRTGSGKTTLARLAVRLYDPTEGAVRLGRLDVRACPLADLRRRVGYVTQDVQLFQGSIRDNLALFDEGVSDKVLMAAIHDLGMSDWFAGLPAGLDSPVAAGGRSLSAGEAQLLALTRVFLGDPGLVILDEASSRVDPATERRIERAVDRLLVDRTAIVIAHRLRTVRRCHQIAILDGGRVSEFGDREALARDTESQFARLLATSLEEVLA
jgi:ATP-binding cassette subfamily B protein